MKGVLLLAAYAAVMLAGTLIFTRRERDAQAFHVGDRRLGVFRSALSIAATWIWAPALLVSSEQAWANGTAGLFWFLVPNVACLLLFIPFARRIRAQMPEGITLSGYMHARYKSDRVRRVYLFQLGGLAVLSTGVQLLAGGKILSLLTGMPLWTMTVALAAITFGYAQFSGIRASVLTDVLQMLTMLLVCALLVPWVLSTGGGLNALLPGLRNGPSLFSRDGVDVLFAFGLPTAIGLLSGPFGDQCFWQRAFSIRKDRIGRAFGLGALLFALVPLSMALLGFVAAGLGFVPTDRSLVNLELIQALLPAWTIVPFVFMLLSGLTSTLDSNLCAAASLTTDLNICGKLDEAGKMRLSKSAMALLLVCGILIANIPGLSITDLFMIYGVLRATTLIPTVLTLLRRRLTANGVFAGVLSALLAGLPLFIYGTLADSAAFKTAGCLATLACSALGALAVTRMEVKRQ